jgi:hypothetical protein
MLRRRASCGNATESGPVMLSLSSSGHDPRHDMLIECAVTQIEW